VETNEAVRMVRRAVGWNGHPRTARKRPARPRPGAAGRS
jgi:hypothetical protein